MIVSEAVSAPLRLAAGGEPGGALERTIVILLTTVLGRGHVGQDDHT
jgi:hypothetical protein